MNKIRTLVCLASCLLSAEALSGCSDPNAPDMSPRQEAPSSAEVEDCAASDEWLPMTPPIEEFMPLPHPVTECPFYRGGWHNFLLAMQPDATGKPTLLSWPTIDTAFTSRFKHPANRSYLGDVKQAGRREILVDQNGNSLYYGIHMNPAFAQFIADNDLKTSDKLQAYPSDPVKKNLFFPAGLVEFKSAWQIVQGNADVSNYISITTTVPTLSQDPVTHAILENRDMPRTVTVRLLAIHVVFTLPGHPEFIWASFEHSKGTPDTAAADGMRDVAPTFNVANPDELNDPENSGVSAPASNDAGFALYKASTPVNMSNHPKQESELHLDVASQKFLVPGSTTPEETSIYRMFPASKSHTTIPDEAITSLNNSVQYLFQQKGQSDKRGHYRLVGGQWMDKPAYFKPDFPIQNDLTSPFAQTGGIGVGPVEFAKQIHADGADSPLSILAGEDRMSSTAMESFTQSSNGSFQNCFGCHNTQAINSNGVPVPAQTTGSAFKLLDAGLLNVSHVISQFILEDCGDNVVQDASGRSAVCKPFVAPQ